MITQLPPKGGNKVKLRLTAGGLQVQNEILSRRLGPSNNALSKVCKADEVAALQIPDRRIPVEIPPWGPCLYVGKVNTNLLPIARREIQDACQMEGDLGK